MNELTVVGLFKRVRSRCVSVYEYFVALYFNENTQLYF